MPTVAYIFDAVRSPRARSRGGMLAATTPVDLLAGVVRAAVLRSPGLDPADVDDLIAGVVSPVGEQGGNIARSAALMAGLPVSVPGVQVNRFCASGLEAVNSAASRVAAGWESLILAGGVESMSRVPLGSDGGAFAADPKTAWDLSFVPQGVSADLIATLAGLSRTEVDDFAVRSQELACAALEDGRFGRSVVPVLDVNGLPVLVEDNHVRLGTTREGLAALPPAFAAAKDFVAVAMQKYPQVETISHVHTGGNSSGIVDGAAITLIGSAEAGARAGVVPRARIVSYAVVGSEPTIMLTGPAPAAAKALRVAGLTPADIDLFEVNEAFAAVVLKFMRDLDVPLEKVNVNGGAIALGHPLGATGAILIGTLVDELERRSLRYGLVAVCVGAGMGVATVIERIDS